MATQRQIDANRENALKSTGPRTEAGKAASSANALSHGLTAASTVVLPEEDTDAFERLREGVIADLDPAGALQAALAQRIAVLLWRLDRATRLEAELFVHGQLAMLRSRADQALDPGARLRRLAELPGESTEAREKIKQFRDQIDVDMCAQAPFAQILVERVESGRTYDLLARHEATLQRALNRTLEECTTRRARQPGRTRHRRPRRPIPTRSSRNSPTRRHRTVRPAAGSARCPAGHDGEKARTADSDPRAILIPPAPVPQGRRTARRRPAHAGAGHGPGTTAKKRKTKPSRKLNASCRGRADGEQSVLNPPGRQGPQRNRHLGVMRRRRNGAESARPELRPSASALFSCRIPQAPSPGRSLRSLGCAPMAPRIAPSGPHCDAGGSSHASPADRSRAGASLGSPGTAPPQPLAVNPGSGRASSEEHGLGSAAALPARK